jgi:hypothetical protein
MHVPQWLRRLRPAFATRNQPGRASSDRALAHDAALPLGAFALVVGGAAGMNNSAVSAVPDYLPGDAGAYSAGVGF